MESDFEASAGVKQILRTSCYPCHSNETRLPWFDRIVPAYQLVVSDVKKGRMALNFSELGAQAKKWQNALLFDAVSQIQMGAMPPARCTLVHREAIVTPSELETLRNYALAGSIPASSDNKAADDQYLQWIADGLRIAPVKAAPNGIEFPSDYKNWKAVSSTDRSDTNTLKMILGNEVAIRAIAEHKINPWPDGTVFAKVSWTRQPETSGNGKLASRYRVYKGSPLTETTATPRQAEQRTTYINSMRAAVTP